MRRVILTGQGLVPRDSPAGGLDHVNVQPVFGIEPQRVRHYDRRGAGDRHKANTQLGFFQWAEAVHQRRLGLGHREYACQRRGDRAAAEQLHKAPAAHVALFEYGAHHRILDRPLHHLFAGLRAGHQRCGGIGRWLLRGQAGGYLDLLAAITFALRLVIEACPAVVGVAQTLECHRSLLMCKAGALVRCFAFFFHRAGLRCHDEG